MKYLLIIIVSVVLLGVILPLTREPILLAIGNFLVIKDELEPADAIHVISGPDNTRIDYAIQLFHQGYAGRMIFTGGWCDCTGANSAEYGRQRALRQGVPPEAIIVDGTEVTSTYAEIGQLKEAITQSQVPIQSVIGVSDPYHMRRARWTYRHVLGAQVAVEMAPVPFGFTPYQRHWWTDSPSRQYVRDEYLKIVYYYARYQLGWGLGSDWLASFDRE
jgi:uncharacterized SAM-binding protein YcdF (DUF218 family)